MLSGFGFTRQGLKFGFEVYGLWRFLQAQKSRREKTETGVPDDTKSNDASQSQVSWQHLQALWYGAIGLGPCCSCHGDYYPCRLSSSKLYPHLYKCWKPCTQAKSNSPLDGPEYCKTSLGKYLGFCFNPRNLTNPTNPKPYKSYEPYKPHKP